MDRETELGYLYCLRLLSRRLHSRHELVQALIRRKYAHDQREAILGRLEVEGYINDRRYAEAWLRTRDHLAPRGVSLLKRELEAKGIRESVINEVIAARHLEQAVEESPSEEALARQLLDKKSGQYRHLDALTRKRRQYALLQRRGFSLEVIRRILEM
jgi:regulatory protein